MRVRREKRKETVLETRDRVRGELANLLIDESGKERNGKRMPRNETGAGWW